MLQRLLEEEVEQVEAPHKIEITKEEVLFELLFLDPLGNSLPKPEYSHNVSYSRSQCGRIELYEES